MCKFLYVWNTPIHTLRHDDKWKRRRLTHKVNEVCTIIYLKEMILPHVLFIVCMRKSFGESNEISTQSANLNAYCVCVFCTQ